MLGYRDDTESYSVSRVILSTGANPIPIRMFRDDIGFCVGLTAGHASIKWEDFQHRSVALLPTGMANPDAWREHRNDTRFAFIDSSGAQYSTFR